MQLNLEQTLARFCAPSLAGIKAADLVPYDHGTSEEFFEAVYAYNRALNRNGLHFLPICGCGKRRLLLVYRTGVLSRCLSDPETTRQLKALGYPVGGTLDEMLAHLVLRMRENAEFPHEIGLFLGYPPADVAEFCRQKGRNCLCCGCWKVYSDVEKAQETFRRYKVCTAALAAKICAGHTIKELFGTAQAV